MPLARRKLPIGVQTFAKIRAEDYYYVDKTPLAWRLTQEGDYYSGLSLRQAGKREYAGFVTHYAGNRSISCASLGRAFSRAF